MDVGVTLPTGGGWRYRWAVRVALLLGAVQLAAGSGCSSKPGVGPDQGPTGDLVDGGADMPVDATADQIGFRLTEFTIDKPDSAENTSFGTITSSLLRLSITKALVMQGLPALNLLMTLSSESTGAITFTICQGHPIVDGMPADDQNQPNQGYQCHGRPFIPTSSPATLATDGTLDVQPFEYVLDIATGIYADNFVFLTLGDYTFNGTFDSEAQIYSGTFMLKLKASNLCMGAVATSGFCPDVPQPDGQVRSNLLDMIDGPPDGCGQDLSAQYMGADPTCATGTDAMHNPPDTMYDGEPAYQLEGKFRFERAHIFPGQGRIPLPAALGGGFCDDPCDLTKLHPPDGGADVGPD
jgi:hypothetical protein